MTDILTGLFLHTVNVGLQAAIIMTVVIAVRFALRIAGYGSSPFYILWMCPLIRLLFPVYMESSVSGMPKGSVIVTSEIMYVTNPRLYTEVAAIDNLLDSTINRVLPAPAPGDSVNPMQVMVFVLALIWILGAAVMLLSALLSVLRIRSKLKSAVRVPGVWGAYYADDLPGAFVFGVIRPGVYIPSDIGREDLLYVIHHEQCHIKRRDHLLKIAAYIALAVYWYHPAVWLMYYMLCREIEFACDEDVIREKNGTYREAYATALLSMGRGRTERFVVPPAFSEHSVKDRIRSVMGRSKRKTVIFSTGILLMLIIGYSGEYLTVPERGGGSAEYDATAEGMAADTYTAPEEGEEDVMSAKKAPAAVVDLSAPVGGDGAELYYTDAERLIFGAARYIFVYDKGLGEVVRALEDETVSVRKYDSGFFTGATSAVPVHLRTDPSRKNIDAYEKNGKLYYTIVHGNATVGEVVWREGPDEEPEDIYRVDAYTYKPFFLPEFR